MRDHGHAELPDQPELYGTPDTRVPDAFAEMLSRRPWHWFVTLTFRVDHERASGGMHPEKADKAFRVLFSKINRECYGVRWFKRPDGGIQWARGQEFHKSGRIHFHALAAAPTADLSSLTRRMRWVDWWWREYGIARIEPPDSQESVNRYVSKYVTKEGKGGEVDFSPNFDRYVPPVLDFGHAAPPTPTSSARHPTQSLMRTGGQAQNPHAVGERGEPCPAFRCLTPQYRPQFLLLNRTHDTTSIDDETKDHDPESDDHHQRHA